MLIFYRPSGEKNVYEYNLYFLQSYGLLWTGLFLKWKIDIRKSLERAGIFIIALPELLAGFNSIPKMIQILFTKGAKVQELLQEKFVDLLMGKPGT